MPFYIRSLPIYDGWIKCSILQVIVANRVNQYWKHKSCHHFELDIRPNRPDLELEVLNFENTTDYVWFQHAKDVALC